MNENKDTEENTHKKSEKLKKQTSILYRLCSRSTLLVSLVLLSLLLLYICGGYQSFTDDTMDFILTLCSFTSIILTLFSAFGLVQSLFVIFFTKQKRTWIFFGIYLFLLIVAPVLLMLFRTINYISQGID